MPSAYPASVRKAALDRLQKGVPTKLIAKELGMSAQSIRQWRRDAGIAVCLSPPLPDDLFLSAWEESIHKIVVCAKLLRIGQERVRRELDRRGIERHKISYPTADPGAVLCTCCGFLITDDWAAASEKDPLLHRLCEEQQNGEVIFYDPER